MYFEVNCKQKVIFIQCSQRVLYLHTRRVLSIIRAWFLFYVKHVLQYVNGHADYMPANHWLSKTGGHRSAAKEWWSNIWYWNSIKGPLSRHTYKKTKLQLCRIKTGMDSSLCVTSATSLFIYSIKSTYRYFSFRFYNKFSLFIPFCHRVRYNTYETTISIIEILDFKISSLHSPQVRFLDFKINIVLYFTISPIYRIGSIQVHLNPMKIRGT
jgi:hypothetical protein